MAIPGKDGASPASEGEEGKEVFVRPTSQRPGLDAGTYFLHSSPV